MKRHELKPGMVVEEADRLGKMFIIDTEEDNEIFRGFAVKFIEEHHPYDYLIYQPKEEDEFKEVVGEEKEKFLNDTIDDFIDRQESIESCIHMLKIALHGGKS